jgi:hypothetical protein
LPPPPPFLRAPLTAPRSFYYTPDQRIAVTGGTTCLQNDVPYDGNQIEFRTCVTGDSQQLFTLEDVQATITSTTAFPDPTTICHDEIQQVLVPADYTNITQKVRRVVYARVESLLIATCTVPVWPDPIQVLLGHEHLHQQP